MSDKNPKVDSFLDRAKQWEGEFEKLRTILLSCQLTEEMKWGTPCYTQDARNIVLMHGFKEYCALLFFKGALLSDPEGVLVKPGENTQSSRQMRFTKASEITKAKATIKSYVAEAMAVEKAGLKVTLKTNAEYAIPDEFQTQLDENPALKQAFEGLTPGRQRAYLLHFSAPKQSKTRESRVAKCVEQILNGKGLND